MTVATYVALALAVAIPVACAMEPWARVLHGRVWHHVLWTVHRSHHEPRLGRFEANDMLSAIHAPFAAAMIIVACQLPRAWPSAVLLGVGSGMTAFGLAYLVVHDGVVHGRLGAALTKRVLRLPGMREIRRAHVVHHTLGGVPYGLFRGPHEMRAAPTKDGARAEAPSAPRASARALSTPAGTHSPDGATSAGEIP